MAEMHMISIVDDDESVREGTADLIRSVGFAAEAFSSAEDFLTSEYVRDTSCLIADMRMPGMTGLELHCRLLGSGHQIPTILATAYPNERDLMRARLLGVIGYVAKPFSDEDLLACVCSAIGSGEHNIFGREP